MNDTVNTTEHRNKVIVIVGGREEVLEQSTLGVNMDSTEAEILAAVQGVIQENLSDSEGEFSYITRKMVNTQNVLIMPKPVAGAKT